MTRKTTGAASQTQRPVTLQLGSGDPLMQYREPKPSTLRQTRETVAGASPKHNGDNGDVADNDADMATETDV